LEMRVAQRTADLADANRRLRAEVAQRQEAEAKIQREKEFSERLINSSVDGILAFDRECRYTLWNPGMERIIGITAPEVLGKCAFDVFPFLREIGQQEVFDKVLRGHDVTADARPYPRPTTGERGFFEGYYSPLSNDAGETIGGLGIVRDVTARKHADEQLESLNKRITSILESMTAGFFALDNELRLTYVNHGAEKIVQRSRETLLGKNVWEVFPEAVGSIVHKQYEQVRAEQVAVETESYFPAVNLWFRVHMYPTSDGISALFEDISERHAREMTVVSNILRALNAEIDVAAAYPSVAAGVHMLTECSRSALGMFDAQQKSVTIVALDQTEGPFPAGIQLLMTDFPGAAEVLTGEPHLVPDLGAECQSPVIQRVFNDGFRSGLGVPLRGTKGVIGMLILLWQRRGGPNLAQLPLMRQIADAVALAAEKSNLFEEVRVKRERLQALSQRLMEVQEEERRHIARELHDEIGQNLTGLKLLLDSVGRLPSEGTVARLGKARELLEDLIGRVRDLSLDLRPAMLDDLGLLPALLWLFSRYTTQTAVRVSFEHKGLEQRLAQEVTTAAYRIVQEALTNVARYAGVNEVAVRAWTEDGSLKLQVVDQGAGFDADRAPDGRGTGGLAGMRERALLLGGRLTVSSAAGTGTRINAELPFGRPPS
jgi:PAS domain S-box-containing protein